jgi:hypothetical protein
MVLVLECAPARAPECNDPDGERDAGRGQKHPSEAGNDARSNVGSQRN